MIFTQLLHSRPNLRQKFLGNNELSTDDTSCLETTTEEDSRSVALKLFQVIDELEKAHKTFEERAMND